MAKTINVLCTKEPWGWLIVHGYKDIENRTWRTDYRGELYISTSKTPYEDEDKYIVDVERQYGVKIPREQLRYGGIIGKIILVDCVTKSKSKWFQKGYYGFVLEHPKRIDFIPIKSQRMIFTMTAMPVKEV